MKKRSLKMMEIDYRRLITNVIQIVATNVRKSDIYSYIIVDRFLFVWWLWNLGFH